MITDWKLLLFLTASTFLPSLIISWFVVGWVRSHASRLGLMDLPNERKVHTVPIPRGGGIGISLGVILTFALGIAGVWLLQLLHRQGAIEGGGVIPSSVLVHVDGLMSRLPGFLVLLVGGVLLTCLGALDDLRGLPWQLRLAVEFGVAAFVVITLDLQLTAFLEYRFITMALSVFWIVLLINSFNMLDNMDALSSGIAAIVCVMLTTMLFTSGNATQGQPQLFVMAMLLALLGGLVGFLRYNWPPATIFMGDAGSYFIGYWIAITTLLATYVDAQGETPQAIFAPLCLLAIPLYDTASVIWIRLREGRSPFKADRRHFSHRLLDLGLTKTQAVWTIYIASITCSLGALLLPRTDKLGTLFVLLIVISMLMMLSMLEGLQGRAIRRTSNAATSDPAINVRDSKHQDDLSESRQDESEGTGSR